MGIPEVTKAAFNDEWLKKCQPCLIVDGLSGWPAERWTPKHLQTVCGKMQVTLSVSHTGSWQFHADGSLTDTSTQYRVPRVSFDLAADRIASSLPSGPKFYVFQTDMSGFPASLLDELRFSEFHKGQAKRNLWFGSANTVTQLHYDSAHNLFAQAYGEKTLTLFAPDQTPFLYQYPADKMMRHLGAVDVDNPDAALHPLFEKAEGQRVTVKAGQVLYIPAFWWHHVRSQSVSISVTHWWRPAFGECRGPTALTFFLHQYQQDGWQAYRTNSYVTREQLVRGAEALLPDNVATAVLPLVVAAEDIERWAVISPSSNPALNAATRRELQAMLASVVQGRGDGLNPARVRGVAEELRVVCEAHADQGR